MILSVLNDFCPLAVLRHTHVQGTQCSSCHWLGDLCWFWPSISLLFCVSELCVRLSSTGKETGAQVMCVNLTVCNFYFPRKSKNKPIIDSSKPLPPQATFRGPYVNTGSRDIGPDPTEYPKK
jgi:hypothetical protein